VKRHYPKKTVIIEKFIPGSKEVSVGVVNKRGRGWPLSPVIRNRALFSSKNISDLSIPAKVVGKVQTWARRLHEALGCRGVTKTDFLIDRENEAWAIETDAIPGLSQNNAVAIGAKKSGISYRDLINLIIKDVR